MRLEPIFTLEELQEVAFRRERSAARRHARTAGLAPRDALESVLLSTAAGTILSALVAERKARNQAQADRRAAIQEASAARFAAKQARRDDAFLRGDGHGGGVEVKRVSNGKAGGCASERAWQAWFDGSAVPNPGRIGIGAVLVSPDGVRTEISAAAGSGDNNRAEYLALIAVLEQAVKFGVQRLTVHGDSRVVFGDLDATAPVRTRDLTSCRNESLRLLRAIPAVRLQWIPRARNADADRLARVPLGLET